MRSCRGREWGHGVRKLGGGGREAWWSAEGGGVWTGKSRSEGSRDQECRKAWKLAEEQRGWQQQVRQQLRETPEAKGRLNFNYGKGSLGEALGSKESGTYQGVRVGSQGDLESLGYQGWRYCSSEYSMLCSTP